MVVSVDRYVQQRLQGAALLPELAQMLDQLASVETKRLAQGRLWPGLCTTVRSVFPDAGDTLDPFLGAWGVLYAATLFLDALQDGDPLPEALPVVATPGRYNLAFSSVLLATSLLDDLAPPQFSASRLVRLRRLWSDMLLQAASGQQRDLGISQAAQHSSLLDAYQQTAQAKTGALFALALGGAATLMTDDLPTIVALTTAGELFGTLVQYSDDVLDADQQPNLTLTLPQALDTDKALLGVEAPDHTPAAFWTYLEQAHLRALGQMLAPLPEAMQQPVRRLFADVFAGHRAKPTADARGT